MTRDALVSGTPGLPRPVRAAVYGDVDLNAIDGSAIFLQTITMVLARAGCDVTLLLKAPVRTNRLLDPIRAFPNVTIRRSASNRRTGGGDRLLTPAQAHTALQSLDAQERFDLVLLRGLKVVREVVDAGTFDGRLWTYLTDVPQNVEAMDEELRGVLEVIARASHHLLCQTEDLRGFLEEMVPSAAGRSELCPPAIPIPPAQHDATQDELVRHHERPLRLVYSGKFAPAWRTMEMCDLPSALDAVGVPAELHALGDQIHKIPDDPSWASRMRSALRRPGIIWEGGKSREDAMRIAAAGDVGLSWRHPALDTSLELSTKVLEYGSLGLPVVLNRTPAHEQLLGADYPLYAATFDDVVTVLKTLAEDPEVRRLAVARCRAAASRYSTDSLVEHIRRLLARSFPARPPSLPAGRTLRVVVAGHDFKFFRSLQQHLANLPGVELRVDQWSSLRVGDEARSREHAAWADVVICEWLGANAVWYARHKRSGQRLLVRLHRVELTTEFPGEVEIDAVDAVICVSERSAELTRKQTGWSADKVRVIPNVVDVDAFDRSKLEGAQYRLGMIGIVPSLKRLDLALDVVSMLRSEDRRFTLAVKSRLPWELDWVWRQPEEQAYAERVFARVRTDPSLQGGVVFDESGPDVPAWLRGVGFVLSTSDGESFHLAPAEGMASGAVPVIRPWPGADTIYDPRWIHDGAPAMADYVRDVVRRNRWDAEREIARTDVRTRYGLEHVSAAWASLVVDETMAAFPSAGARAAATPAVPTPSAVGAARTAGVAGGPRRESDAATPVSQLRVLGVLDTMSKACFGAESQLVTPAPDEWGAALDEHNPHLLLVESAWKGNDETWQYRVGTYNKPESHGLPDLSALVGECRKRGVPTVFWNKEDPVHFERFRQAAALFDVVLTSDADTIPRYRSLGGAIEVLESLMFAAQPRLHNPIATGEDRSTRPVFAGTFYRNRHESRQAPLEMLLQAALPFGLVIYDRMFGSGSPDFGFPDSVAKTVAGVLPYDEVVRTYKRHRVFLNTNSVTDSPTMFSRRVFELLACGTAVVSTPSVGMRHLFGDIVAVVEDEAEATEALRSFLTDDEVWHTASAAGVRRVMLEHTYANRMEQIARVAGLAVSTARPDVTVLARAEEIDPAALLKSVDDWPAGAGDGRPTAVAIAMSSGDTRTLPDSAGGVPVLVIREDDAGRAWRELAAAAPTPWVAIAGDAPFTPTNLADLQAAAVFADADVIGPHVEQPQDWRRGHRYTSDLSARATLARRSLVEERGWPGPDADGAKVFSAWAEQGVRFYCAGQG